LTTAAYAGIGVGAGITVIAVAGILWYFLHRQTVRKKQSLPVDDKDVKVQDLANTTLVPIELDAKHGQTEMNARSIVYEIGEGR
jgi:hypothetical protein